VDGHAVLWLGTGGASLKTAGYAPADINRQITAGAGLSGGGTLAADRTLSLDPCSQAEAEAGTNNTKAMTPLRSRQFFDHANQKASQAEAEAGSNDTKWISALKVNNWFDHANQKANQSEAEAGTDDTKWMSALRVNQAIELLAKGIGPINHWTITTSATDTGRKGSQGAYFMSNSIGSLQISTNGGTNYTNCPVPTFSAMTFIAVKGNLILVWGIGVNEPGGPGTGYVLQATTTSAAPTSGAGNIFLKTSSGTTPVSMMV
jgi:hypothetical protein